MSSWLRCPGSPGPTHGGVRDSNETPNVARVLKSKVSVFDTSRADVTCWKTLQKIRSVHSSATRVARQFCCWYPFFGWFREKPKRNAEAVLGGPTFKKTDHGVSAQIGFGVDWGSFQGIPPSLIHILSQVTLPPLALSNQFSRFTGGKWGYFLNPTHGKPAYESTPIIPHMAIRFWEASRLESGVVSL